MLSSLSTVAALALTASASFHGNLNYRSASNQHEELGLDIPVIEARIASLKPRADLRNFTNAQLNFTHGVASGDPFEDSVILWTRLAPSLASDSSNITVTGTAPLWNHETDDYVRASSHKVCVDWKIAKDKNFTRVVDDGQVFTSSDIDFTVKVEAGNLKPFTQYYYQFSQCDTKNKSPIGRTKTSPAEDDDTKAISFAVFSCSNYPNGYFNAYGNAARRNTVDFFVHLGDYIYETSTGVLGRDARATNPPKEIVTLYDYRTRIAQYRTDLDLKLAHQDYAWITTWDDHEFADNGYRDGFSRMNNTEASFIQKGGIAVDQRKMNAVRAYFEWMPIRQTDMDDGLRVWRSFKMGKLVDFIVLDTRNYDRSITDLYWNADYLYDIRNDTGRTMMGARQENWFYNKLIQSKRRGAQWRLIGNQVVFSRINTTSWFGTAAQPFNNDQWDGYLANRNRTFQTLYDHGIDNNIMLAGDSHANWVSDLVWLDEHPYDPATGKGAVGVEFAGTAVTSSGFGGTIAGGDARSANIIRDNSELQWNEGYYRGWFSLSIGKDFANASYFGVPTVAQRTPLELPLANFTVLSGANRVQRPVGNGRVLAGAVKGGVTQNNNLTYNTETGEWAVRNDFNEMFIKYSR